jgi:hypothetical protein
VGVKMKIYISPNAIIFLAVISVNLIFGFGKSKVLKTGYIIVSSFLSAVGIIGLFVIRTLFITRLNKSFNNGRLEADFVTWAMDKFDYYALISIIATCFVILVLIIVNVMVYRYKNKTLGYGLTAVVNVIRLIIIISGIWYGFGTLNKLFDVAGYLALVSISEALVFYIPLIVSRILILKNKD